MDLLIAYVIIGYFWGIWAISRSLELFYPMGWINYIIGFSLNSIFWPISMVMAYWLETKMKKEKTNKWIT